MLKLDHVDDGSCSSDHSDGGGQSPLSRHSKNNTGGGGGRSAFRRHNAYNNLATLMADISQWIQCDEDLAVELRRFIVQKAKDPSGMFHILGLSSKEADELGAAQHLRKQLHKEFEMQFDTLLMQYLIRHNISQEQLEAIFKLDEEEERLHGTHFHRWITITDYELFVKAMHASATNTGDPIELIRNYITAKSSEARRAYKTVHTLEPLLEIWNPDTFTQVLDMLRDSPVKPSHDKQTKKELLRWSNVLAAPVLSGSTGQYAPPTRDLEKWLRYMVLWMEGISAEDTTSFESFVSYFVDVVNAKIMTAPEEAVRHQLWRIFRALDLHKTSQVDFRQLSPLFMRLSTTPEAERSAKKLIAKWMAKTKVQADDRTPRMVSIHQFMEFANEIGNALGLVDPIENWTQALSKIADHVEEVVA